MTEHCPNNMCLPQSHLKVNQWWDYCVVPHDFHVHLAMDLFKQIEHIKGYGYINPKHNTPDHSLLTWCIMYPDIDVNDKGTNTIQERISFTKWKLDNIPGDLFFVCVFCV